MGATTSMIYSGAVDATVGTVVSGAFSSISSTDEMHEELDVTLFSLYQEVMKIECAINEAKRRQINNRKLLMWLTSLIDAVCVGNYYYRAFTSCNSHYHVIAREGATNLAISPFYHVAKRRRTIKTLFCGDEEIRELYKTLKKLKSIDLGMFIQMVNGQPERSIRTYLYMDHNRLFGLDKERGQVMNFLLGRNMAGENNVDILPIVGSVGAGRTSLALHCLHDLKVQAHFSLKLYNKLTSFVYGGMFGSVDFHIMLKDLVEQCNFTSITSDDEHTLIAMLKQSICSERFFIVLDNVVELDSRVWNFFQDCLMCGKQGSKVILIFNFRGYNAFKKIVNPGEVEPVIVDGFSEDEYMSFFEQQAFGSVDPEECPDLAKIGMEIAKKLGGSIWGAKIFGELLRENLNVEFWSYFLGDGLLPCQTHWSHHKCILRVTTVIFHLLRLPTAKLRQQGISQITDNSSVSNKIPNSYRELMVLSPNHLIPKYGRKLMKVLVTKHVLLNKCTFIYAEFGYD